MVSQSAARLAGVGGHEGDERGGEHEPRTDQEGALEAGGEGERGVAARVEDGVGACGGDGGEDGEAERAAELHGGVEQPGRDARLVGWDAVGGRGGDAGEDGAGAERTALIPGRRSARKAPWTGTCERK